MPPIQPPRASSRGLYLSGTARQSSDSAWCREVPKRCRLRINQLIWCLRCWRSSRWSAFATGRFVMVAESSAVNFRLGNAPVLRELNQVTHRDHFTVWDRLVREPVEHGIRSTVEANRWIVGETLREIAAQPRAWLSLMAAKALELVNGAEIPRNTSIYPDRAYSTVLRWITIWVGTAVRPRRVCSSVQAARIASVPALPPKTVLRWLMLGASGAERSTPAASIACTETRIARVSGMWVWRYRSTAFRSTGTTAARIRSLESQS